MIFEVEQLSSRLAQGRTERAYRHSYALACNARFFRGALRDGSQRAICNLCDDLAHICFLRSNREFGVDAFIHFIERKDGLRFQLMNLGLV